MLLHSVGLIHKDHGCALWKEIEKVLGHRVKIVNIALKRSELPPLHRLLFHTGDRGLKAVRLLGMVLIPVELLYSFFLFPDALEAVSELTV